MFKGIAVSPGVVVGTAYRVETAFSTGEVKRLEDPSLVPREIGRFEQAIEESAAELGGLVVKVAEQLGPDEAAIFQTHLAIIRDKSMLAKVRELISGQHVTALSALQSVFQDYAATFARQEHEFFRERMADVRDVLSRIGSHLSLADVEENSHSPKSPTDDPVILIAGELLPSQAMNLGELPIGGIVTETGGGTSHVAILSRSRGIPAVSGVVGIVNEVQNGDLIVVDGRDGYVVVRPDPETASAYRKMQREFFDLKDRLVLNRDQPAVSADGGQLELLANINGISDARAAVAVGSTGIGLFRTEYLFLSHTDVPDEEEQYQNYKQVIEATPNRTVTIRTLDLGGDKTVPYLGRRYEANPFMGWRSIRLSFEHPRLFESQIRAILRAGSHGKVSMLFPMITTLEELRYVNKLVQETRRSLLREGIPFGDNVKTGVMVEVPAAAMCIDALLRETDFISVGSNDLIQYLVAADRDNPKVAHLCEPLSPAIFRILQMVFDACRRTGTPVTVCGEMAGQPRSVLALFGMGLRRFSMSPAFVPTIKALLSRVTTAQAERFAHHVLQLKTSEEIRKYLSERLHEVASDLEGFDFT
jgi:phosphotransferase system enzyme I (PtsI)